MSDAHQRDEINNSFAVMHLNLDQATVFCSVFFSSLLFMQSIRRWIFRLLFGIRIDRLMMIADTYTKTVADGWWNGCRREKKKTKFVVEIKSNTKHWLALCRRMGFGRERCAIAETNSIENSWVSRTSNACRRISAILRTFFPHISHCTRSIPSIHRGNWCEKRSIDRRGNGEPLGTWYSTLCVCLFVLFMKKAMTLCFVYSQMTEWTTKRIVAAHNFIVFCWN